MTVRVESSPTKIKNIFFSETDRLDRKESEWPITLPPQTVRNGFAIESSKVTNIFVLKAIC